MFKRLPRYKRIGFIGYLAGAAAVANCIHQQMPLLRGEDYTFDHGANLANEATLLISAVAILTSKALEELESKFKDIASSNNSSAS